MLRRPLLALLAVVLFAATADAAPFANPVKVFAGTGSSCTARAEAQARNPVVAGSASGPAVVAAFAPNCNIVAALRRPGARAFGAAQSIGGSEATGPPVAAVDAAGDAAVAWPDSSGCRVAFAPAASGVFGPTERTPSTSCLIALDGSGRVIVSRGAGLVDRSPGGSYSPPTVPFLAGASIVALAANVAGDTVAVADSASVAGGRNLQVAVRRAGGAWGAAKTLATGIALTGRVSAAIDSGGGVIVVWAEPISGLPLPSTIGQGAVLKYATGNTSGTFGAPTPVPSAGSAVLDPRYQYALAANARGEATIVFAAITGPLSGGFFLSDRPAGGAFGPAAQIGSVQTAKLQGAYTNLSTTAVPLVASRQGDGTLVLVQGIEDVRSPFLQARVRPPGGAFGAPVWLSTVAEGQLLRNPAEVAASASPDGTTLVAWRGQQSRQSGVFVAGAALGPAAAAGSTPPVKFSVLRVQAVGRSVRGRVRGFLRVRIRSSRATTGTFVIRGATVPFAVKAGIHNVRSNPFGLRTLRVRPGQRVAVVFDVAGAGPAKVSRTIRLPR